MAGGFFLVVFLDYASVTQWGYFLLRHARLTD